VKPLRTKKQRIIMAILLRTVGAGEFMNVTQLHAALPYKCAYGSLRMSVDALEANGFIVKERAGMSILLVPTKSAYDWFSEDRV
jgi:hypothetical protein